jgi:hypothetical protein
MPGRKLAVVLAAALALGAAAKARAAEPRSALDRAVDRVIQHENQLMARVDRYRPLVELYIQDMRADRELGAVPSRDFYFLGKADLAHGLAFHPLVGKTGHKFFNFFSSSYDPDGFLHMIYPDARGLDREHYSFQYVRREFLGDVRCLVFDVTPRPHSGQGRFKGRIWVEDRDFAIVRFNGVFYPAARFGMYFHFDSWRVNVGPGLWLPAYTYSEESDKKEFLERVRFRAQMRLWGYNLSPAAREEELGRILVESSPPVSDQSQASHDLSPVQAERAFQSEAEENVLDRLEQLGLLAPRGPVDQVLDTVLNNLEVSNNLNVQPEIHCRVLLTTTLESFAVGHTIVLSRGLIDVLPDEASLATVLSQELAGILLGHTIDTKYAFSDRMIFNVKDTFHVLSFREDQQSEAEASAKAVELLRNSPYKNSLANAGLFLKALQAQAKELPQLISPRLGNRPEEIQALETLAPELEPRNVRQIAALPLGSRVKVDPWNDRISLMKSQPVGLLSAREKMPFELAPFFPHLERQGAAAASAGTLELMSPPGQPSPKGDPNPPNNR